MRYKLPIYPVTVFIYRGYRGKVFEKAILKETKEKLSQKTLDDMNGGRASCSCNGSHVVLRFDEKRPPVDIIAHEALHATIGIMEHTGIKLDDSSDEAYTYLLGYIVKLIHEDTSHDKLRKLQRK